MATLYTTYIVPTCSELAVGLSDDNSEDIHRKNSKNWDTIMITVLVVKVERYGLTLPECI